MPPFVLTDFERYWGGRTIDDIEAEIDLLRRKLELTRLEERRAEQLIRELETERTKAQQRQK